MDIKTDEQFINLIAPAVIESCKKYGWGVPSAIIAQATLESMKSTGWSGLASTCFNFWGMKWNSKYGCGYKEYQTKEQRADGSYYTVVSKFCKVNSVQEGIELYFKFIEMNKRYAKVMQSKDYVSYATEIRLAGWATSLSYTNNIINRVVKYGLSAKYDNAEYVSQSPYTIGQTYTTTTDLYVRKTANGANVEFDDLTDNAKKNAYEDSSGFGILKRGTRVTCKEIKQLNKSTWIKIPSGWICAKNATTSFIE